MTRRIDAYFDEKQQPTLSQDERTFRTQFLAGLSAVLQGLDIVSLIILVIMTLILGNTIAMGVRERTSEYGTLRAIGFMPKHVTLFILSEAAVPGLLGGAFGGAAAFLSIRFVLSELIEKNMGGVFPYFRAEVPLLVGALLLAGFLGVMAAAVPAFTTSRLTIVDSLRRTA